MRIAPAVVLMVSMAGVMHALTSKQLPGTGGTDPACNPNAAPASGYAVSGPHVCYCSEAIGGGVGSATASYPPLISIIGVFNVSVVVECTPEQYNSTPTTCNRRSDCAPDVTYSMPGWMYDWTLQGKPVFTIDARAWKCALNQRGSTVRQERRRPSCRISDAYRWRCRRTCSSDRGC